MSTLPTVPLGLDQKLNLFLRSVKVAIETGGTVVVENADLTDIESRLAIIEASSGSTGTGGGSTPIVPDANFDIYDTDTPPIPTGLTATATRSFAIIEWDGPAYGNQAYITIYRASVDDRTQAVKVGTSTYQIYADYIKDLQTQYYWITSTSWGGIESGYNAVAGTPATSLVLIVKSFDEGVPTGMEIDDVWYTGTDTKVWDGNAWVTKSTVGADWSEDLTSIPYETVYNNDDSVALGFNPTFSAWSGTLPDNWGGREGIVPTKETVLVNVGDNAVRYDNLIGVNAWIFKTASFSSSPLPAGTFISGTVNIYLPVIVSGAPGVLVRLYTNSGLTVYEDNYVNANSVLNTWQRINFTARASGDPIYGISIFLMGSWTSGGMTFSGSVIFDNLRFALFDNSVDNTDIVVNADGSIDNAGGGQVTISGLGYSGDLTATDGATWGTNIQNEPVSLDEINSAEFNVLASQDSDSFISGNIIPNGNMTMVGIDGRPQGAKASYGSDVVTTIDYLDAEKTILRLYHVGDDTIGVGFPAFQVTIGTTYKVFVRVKSNVASTSGGLYIGLTELDTALGVGETHIGQGPFEAGVVTFTRVLWSRSNIDIGTSWETHEFTYTPTASAIHAGLTILNYIGMGLTELHVDRVVITDNSTEGATWGADIDDQPSDEQLLNALVPKDVYNGVPFPFVLREIYVPCYVTNDEASNNWFKLAEKTLTINYDSITFRGSFSWGGSSGRFNQQARVNFSVSVVDPSSTKDTTTFSYSGDDPRPTLHLREYQNGSSEWVIGVYVYLGSYQSAFLNGTWFVRSAGGWIDDNQTQADVLSGDPGYSAIVATQNYELGSTDGAEFGNNISGQITPENITIYMQNLAIHTAQMALASIGDAQISSLTADKITAVNLSAFSTNFGTMVAGLMTNGDGNFVIDLTNKFITIAGPNGVAADNYIKIELGRIIQKVWTGTKHQDAASLSTLEGGTASNGSTITLERYYRTQPNITVTAYDTPIYKAANSGQDQTIQIRADNIVESPPGSGTWKFDAVSRLVLGDNSSTETINDTTGPSSSGTLISDVYFTPQNTATTNVSIDLTSFRGTGTAPNYYHRKVIWKLFYRIKNSGSAYSSITVTTKYIGSTLAAVIDSNLFTFPSSNEWDIYIEAAYTDYTGTFTDGSGGYVYYPDQTVYLATDTAIAKAYSDNKNTEDVATLGINLPSFTPEPGYSVYDVTYTLSYGWYFTASDSGTVFGYARIYKQTSSTKLQEQYGDGTQGTTDIPNSMASTVWTSTSYTQSHTALTLKALGVDSSGASSTAGRSWSKAFAAGTKAVIKQRKVITNSTTPENTLKINDFIHSLTGATELGAGTLGWQAIL